MSIIEAPKNGATGCDNFRSIVPIRGEVIPFQGRTQDYNIETYFTRNGSSFIEMPEAAWLVKEATDLYLNVYPNRDRDISIRRMQKTLSNPRTILMLVKQGDISVGWGIFTRLLIQGEPVFYSSRAFREEHQGQGLGQYVLNEGIRLHQIDAAKGHRTMEYGVLMTQNAPSIVSLEKAPLVGDIFPVKKRYDQDQHARYLMLRTHSEVMLNSNLIETATGVSRGELAELGMNENIRPSRLDSRAWEIDQLLVTPTYRGGLNLNREGGDVVYVTFKILRQSQIPDKTMMPGVA